MSSNPLDANHKLLAAHLSYAHRIGDASLPLPLFDPNPRLTLALLDMWDILQEIATHVPGHNATFSLEGPGQPSVLDMLRAIRPFLVCPFKNFLYSTF